MPRKTTLAESAVRFWSRVNKDGPTMPHMETCCWVWTGGIIQRRGYGRMSWNRKMWKAHRFSWLLAHGAVADDLGVLHRCDNRPCVRPDHLFIGTAADNNADMVKKMRHARGDAQGLRKHPDRRPFGERSGSAVLTDDAVLAIRLSSALGDTVATLSHRMGVSLTTVRDVINRRTWKHLPEAGFGG